eukprot:9075703-Pyramimonas_sp.AAC.1
MIIDQKRPLRLVNREEAWGGSSLPMRHAPHVRTRTGHRDPGSVVSLGPCWPEYGRSLEREPRL